MIFSKLESQLEDGKCVARYGEPGSPFFCFVDYDKRHYDINMNFQHFHTFYEIYVLISDNAVHVIEGKYYDLQQYDIVCLQPGLLHKTFYKEGDYGTRLVLQFQPNLAAESLREDFNRITSVFDDIQPVYRFDEKNQEHLMYILRDMLKENKQQNNNCPLVTNSMLMEFLSQLNSSRDGNQYKSMVKINETDKRIYEISSFIHSNYADNISLEMLAEKFFISPSHLSRRFHKITGFKLIEYIQRTRLRNAQEKLVFTDEKISDIAEDCGFSSFSQFSRVFRHFHEISPTDYRKNYRYNDAP